MTTVKVCQCIAYNVVQTFKIMPRKAAVHVPRKVAYPCSLSVRKEHCMQEGIDRMRNKLIADEDILAAPWNSSYTSQAPTTAGEVLTLTQAPEKYLCPSPALEKPENNLYTPSAATYSATNWYEYILLRPHRPQRRRRSWLITSPAVRLRCCMCSLGLFIFTESDAFSLWKCIFALPVVRISSNDICTSGRVSYWYL